MDKTQKLEKAKALLTQAMREATAAMPNNQNVLAARNDINRAIKKIDKAHGTQSRRQTTPTQFENWWGHIQSGTAQFAMSPEASQKSLDQLNALIAKEQDKLTDLAANSDNQSDQILHD